VRESIDSFGGFMLGFLLNLPFTGNGIENHFTPDEFVYEVQPVLPQWLRERVGRWQAEADLVRSGC
jgi:hypothetical protein